MSIEGIFQHEARRVRSPQTRDNDNNLRLGNSPRAGGYGCLAYKVLADFRVEGGLFLNVTMKTQNLTRPVVGTDGVIQEREAELLRAITDPLDCPIPPLVQIAEKQ